MPPRLPCSPWTALRLRRGRTKCDEMCLVEETVLEATGRAAYALSGTVPDSADAASPGEETFVLLNKAALNARLTEMDEGMSKLHVSPPEGAGAVDLENLKEASVAAAASTSSTPAAAAAAPMEIDPVTPPSSGPPVEEPRLRPRKREPTLHDGGTGGEADAAGSETPKIVDGEALVQWREFAAVHPGLPSLQGVPDDGQRAGLLGGRLSGQPDHSRTGGASFGNLFVATSQATREAL